MDNEKYILNVCPVCSDEVIYELGYYFCRTEPMTYSHFCIDTAGFGPDERSGVQIYFIQLKLEKFNVELDVRENHTVIYPDDLPDFYKIITKLLSYDEIFKYHDLWVLS